MRNDIDTIELLKYLKNTGWREVKIKNKAIKVFQFEGVDKELHQVTIPMDRGLNAYWNIRNCVYYAFHSMCHFWNHC